MADNDWTQAWQQLMRRALNIMEEHGLTKSGLLREMERCSPQHVFDNSHHRGFLAGSKVPNQSRGQKTVARFKCALDKFELDLVPPRDATAPLDPDATQEEVWEAAVCDHRDAVMSRTKLPNVSPCYGIESSAKDALSMESRPHRHRMATNEMTALMRILTDKVDRACKAGDLRGLDRKELENAARWTGRFEEEALDALEGSSDSDWPGGHDGRVCKVRHLAAGTLLPIEIILTLRREDGHSWRACETLLTAAARETKLPAESSILNDAPASREMKSAKCRFWNTIAWCETLLCFSPASIHNEVVECVEQGLGGWTRHPWLIDVTESQDCPNLISLLHHHAPFLFEDRDCA